MLESPTAKRMHIRYAKEEKTLGTGGAIANAMKYIHTTPFFVLNGDVLLSDFSLQEMLEGFHDQMAGLLLSVHVDDIRPYGEIVSDSNGKVTTFREKQPIYRAGYVNGGVYLFNQTIADTFPKHQEVFSIERDVFPSISNLYALETDAIWIDIGVPERLAYARQSFSKRSLPMNRDIFRAYDIRGIFGMDFEPNDFYRIARAFADRFQPKTVAVGHDVRESSPQLWQKVVEGLIDSGVNVLNLGQISTDMLYFAVTHYQTDGGIIISASHNPAVYNGMKLVGRHATPISSDTGLYDLRDAIASDILFEKRKMRCRGCLQSGTVSGGIPDASSLVCEFAAVVQKADCHQRK